MQKLKAGLGAVLALGLCIGALLLFSDRIVLPPPNARMIVDSERKTFASVPCVISGVLERELIRNREDIANAKAALRLQPYAEEAPMWMISDMRRIGGEHWRRDGKCNATSGFDQRETFWARIFGQPSRWTGSGDWRF